MKRLTLLFFIIIIPSLSYAFEQVEFKKKLGQEGPGPGQLSEPSDIAVDKDGKIFIADRSNKRINVMNQQGRTLSEWKSRRVDIWQLEEPSGIALSKDRVYVTDSYHDKVLIFSKKGKFIDQFGGSGSKPKQFDNPRGLYVHQGIVYVADSGNHRVQTFSLDGIYLRSIGKKGKSRGEMRNPVDVAVDYKGNIYVAEEGNDRIGVIRNTGYQYKYFYDFSEPSSIDVDSKGFFVGDAGNYKIKKYTFEGRLILSFGTKGDKNGQFRSISGLSVDRDGKIFIIDSKRNNIQVFSPEKTIGVIPDVVPPKDSVKWVNDIKAKVTDMVWHEDTLYATDKENDALLVIQHNALRKIIKGEGTNKLSEPYGIAIDPGGSLWVADSDNDRIVKVNREGKIMSTIGRSGSKEGRFSSPSGIAISQKGLIYIADTGNERVQIFNTKGVFISKIENMGKEDFDEPVDVGLDRSGNIYVVDRGRHKVAKYNQGGRYRMSIGGEGDTKGKFKDPNSVLIMEDEIFVLDAGNDRVQVFSLDGSFLRKFGTSGKGKGDFMSPTAITARDNITLYVSDRGNIRIQEIKLLMTPQAPLKLKAEARQNQVTLNWTKNPESFIDYYRVYRSEHKMFYKLIGSPSNPSYRDREVKPSKDYYYKVSAVAREGNESAKSPAAKVRTALMITKPPIDISVVRMHDIVPRNYKTYEKNGIAEIQVMNNSDKVLYGVKVSFMIEDLMSKPSVVKIKKISPKRSVKFPFKRIYLKNKIFALKEDTTVEATVQARYSFNGNQSESVDHPVRVLLSGRRYSKTQAKQFIEAMESLNEKVARNKTQESVAQEVKKDLDTTDIAINGLRERNLDYGEITVCLYISNETDKSSVEIVAIQEMGQSWQNIMSIFDLDIVDVTSTLKRIEKAAEVKKIIKPKPKPKPKRRRRQTEDYVK